MLDSLIPTDFQRQNILPHNRVYFHCFILHVIVVGGGQARVLQYDL